MKSNMLSVGSYGQCLLMYELLPVLYIAVVTTQNIVSGPRSAAAVPGSSTAFHCTVVDPLDSTQVFWQVLSNSVLINPEVSIPSNYASRFSTTTEVIDEMRHEYRYSLIINNLEQTDNGEYHCRMIGRHNSVGVDVASATLDIISPDINGRPTCFANPSGELSYRERVVLTCISTSSTADLVWRSNGQLLPTTSSTKYADSTSEFSFTPIQDGQKYSCVSVSQTNQCSLTLTVKYPPIVHIAPDESVIRVGHSTSFTCTATGNPDSFSYLWYYSGIPVADNQHHRLNHFQLEEDGRILSLPDISMNDDGVLLACEVTNSIGIGVGQYNITITEGKTTAETVGPIIVALIAFIILIILIFFTIWYCQQKKIIRGIKRKEKIRRAESQRRKRLNVAVIPSSITSVSMSNGGHISDGIPYKDDDEDRLRPIPRRKSESSSIGKKYSNEDSISDYIVQDMSMTEEDQVDDALYVYQVNPHFTETKNKGSYVVNHDDESDHSEVDQISSDFEDIDSIIPSTDL